MASNDSLAISRQLQLKTNLKIITFWCFEQKCESGIAPVSGPIVKEKALGLNIKVGDVTKYTAHIAWLPRQKDCHRINNC